MMTPPSSDHPTRERMSPGFAVFNGHVNDADKRARAVMSKRCPVYLARVEAIEREGNGIMHLFDVCGPTWGPKAGRRYIELVTRFVNEDAIAMETGTAIDSEAGVAAKP